MYLIFKLINIYRARIKRLISQIEIICSIQDFSAEVSETFKIILS